MLIVPSLTLAQICPDPALAPYMSEGIISELRSNGASSLVFIVTFDLADGPLSLLAQYLNTSRSLSLNTFLMRKAKLIGEGRIEIVDYQKLKRVDWLNVIARHADQPTTCVYTPQFWEPIPSHWTDLSDTAQDDVLSAFRYSNSRR